MGLTPSETRASFLQASTTVILVLLVRNHGEPLLFQQYKKGGPIIAVQVENEYGSYAKDPNYMAYVKMVMLARLLISVMNLTHRPPSL